jgi:hypothetical protein
MTMSKVEEIEKAVAELPADELARFRAWFEEFETARFDERIEHDAKAGKLDQLAEQALAEFHAGRARESFGADSAGLIGSLKGKLTIKGEILATGIRWDSEG